MVTPAMLYKRVQEENKSEVKISKYMFARVKGQLGFKSLEFDDFDQSQW